MEISVWAWGGFLTFVTAMLALDLGVFHRRPHEVTVREAIGWSVVWIVMALIFNAGIFMWLGKEPALEFLTGYLIEKSLSIDNVFVFALIFSAFRVPRSSEHTVLFWGIFGALVMRGLMILVGVSLIERFHWMIYLFGALLVWTGIRMLRSSHSEMDPAGHWSVRLVQRLIPVSPEYHGPRFLIRTNGKLIATPLLLVLVLVEVSDLIFAIDSIPAIIAVTKEPFLVFTSNVFAMLGLRSLYFALSGVLARFSSLKYGLSAILVFVGCKMLLAGVITIPPSVSLLTIATILISSLAIPWFLQLIRPAPTL